MKIKIWGRDYDAEQSELTYRSYTGGAFSRWLCNELYA